MNTNYQPEKFWDKAHREVESGQIQEGLGIRHVGGGENPLEAKYLYALREFALKRSLKNVIGTLPAGKCRVFEFGCGSGYWLNRMPRLLPAREIIYTGADISPSAIERLKAKYPAPRFVCLADSQDGWNTINAGGPYDLALAIDVLYHITDEAIWQREVTRILSSVQPGGWFIFTDYGYRQFDPAPGSGHVKTRDLQMYLDLLAEHGFSVVSIIPMFYFFNRIKFGPWKDHGALTAALWKIIRRIPFLMPALCLADKVMVYFIRPLDPNCKKRMFVCQKNRGETR